MPPWPHSNSPAGCNVHTSAGCLPLLLLGEEAGGHVSLEGAAAARLVDGFILSVRQLQVRLEAMV